MLLTDLSHQSIGDLGSEETRGCPPAMFPWCILPPVFLEDMSMIDNVNMQAVSFPRFFYVYGRLSRISECSRNSITNAKYRRDSFLSCRRLYYFPPADDERPS